MAVNAGLLPAVRQVQARWRRIRYERSVARFLRDRDGRAERLPAGLVYEAAKRCSLGCELRDAGDQARVEDDGREEVDLSALDRALPAQQGLQVNLTGGEIFVRQDIMEVFALLRSKGYACAYLTTNGASIDEARADGLARLAADGLLRHVSVSIDGPEDLPDDARGVPGTFARTAAGLRRLRTAANRLGAPLRISINATVARESLESLDEIVDVADEVGVHTIGLNHLMYATPQEVDDTLRIIGEADPSLISTFVTSDPGVRPGRVRAKVAALASRCRARGILFHDRPKVHPELIDGYYTPGAPLHGRCLYPFLNARVSAAGKMHFCPFIRVEVGDVTEAALEESWNGERYVELRRRLLHHGLFPVCRRCCKVELTPAVAERSPDVAAVPGRVSPAAIG